MAEKYVECCPECMGETVYTILDIDKRNQIECGGCRKKILPCDLCIYHGGGCGGECDSALSNAVRESMKGYIILETYPQPLCEDASDEWHDSHLLLFAVKEPDLKRVLTLLERDYTKFMNEWTWDETERVYAAAKGSNIDIVEKIIER